MKTIAFKRTENREHKQSSKMIKRNYGIQINDNCKGSLYIHIHLYNG